MGRAEDVRALHRFAAVKALPLEVVLGAQDVLERGRYSPGAVERAVCRVWVTLDAQGCNQTATDGSLAKAHAFLRRIEIATGLPLRVVHALAEARNGAPLDSRAFGSALFNAAGKPLTRPRLIPGYGKAAMLVDAEIPWLEPLSAEIGWDTSDPANPGFSYSIYWPRITTRSELPGATIPTASLDEVLQRAPSVLRAERPWMRRFEHDGGGWKTP